MSASKNVRDCDVAAQTTMRLDKWLWVARFFKTRQLAIGAINGGKVHLNGQRSKPSKDVRPGCQLSIHKGSFEWEVEVLGLATQRRPAAEALLLYQETVASITKREQVVAAQHLLKAAGGLIGGARPTKRERRQIHRFTQGEG